MQPVTDLTYLEAMESFPVDDIVLETKRGDAKVIKIDILKGVMWFLVEGDSIETSPYAIKIENVSKILELNKKNVKVDDLEKYAIKENVKIQDKEMDEFSDINSHSKHK